MKIPSKYLENAVDQLGTLPGIGKRTALRLTLHLLKKNEIEVMDFTQAIIDLKNKLFHVQAAEIFLTSLFARFA